MTVDFELSLPEVELYMKINNYLKKEILFALPNSHRTLITSVKSLSNFKRNDARRKCGGKSGFLL